MLARFDHRLVAQALTNIVKNATEAIDARASAAKREPGIMTVGGREGRRGAIIDVEDNGKGLPAEDRERLLEPYMTTREKGTGLGLAIVGRSWRSMAARSSCSTRARSPAAGAARSCGCRFPDETRDRRRVASRLQPRRPNERPGR